MRELFEPKKEEIKEPKLFVDVNIGKSGMERIVVFEGDKAEDLARNFCLNNGLNDEMESKLRQLLEQQISGVLPQIEEDDQQESEEESIDSKVYEEIMQSISKLWAEFDQDNGLIDEESFLEIMIAIANDQGLLSEEGSSEE